MHEWSDYQIRDYYDLNPHLTILTYAGMLDGSAVDKEEEAMAEEMGNYCTPYNPEEDR